MPKKAKVETPPSMLGIMRFDVDTTRIRLEPKVVLGIILGFVALVLLLNYVAPLE
ncbi:MAG: hypothetical protein PWP76_451 [Candidatus Diapherotrites archaeon]|nr:hypothetical protein [Candidatus Diapherotrites archaeon]